MGGRAVAVVATLLAVVAGSPWAEGQQPGKVYRIGFLGLGGASLPVPEVLDPFREGLREAGWIDGQNYVIEFRGAHFRAERLPDVASELVRLGVDIIVTAGGEPAILAAKNATRTIPIVMAVSADPVGSGLVATLARPGGNVTGLSILAPEVAGKRLELLREVLPRASRIAVLFNAADPAKSTELVQTQVTARALGVRLQAVEVRGADDLAGAFATIAAARPDGLITLADSLTNTHRTRIADFATRSRLPMVSELRTFADAGGLLTYGPSFADLMRRSATYVDKILKGARPADLPVEQPTKFELVINLRTARALRLTIPPSVLLRADTIIDR